MTGFSHIAVPAILGLRPYQPGKPESELQRELGLSDIVKLASNENPLGPSPAALEAMKAGIGNLSRYPDGSGYALKRKLAERLHVRPDQITLGNGSSEVLELIARIFLGAGREAVFSEYAFAMYPIFVQAVGAKAKVARALKRDSSMPYGHDLDQMAELVNAETRLVFIANPNNPTGTYLSESALYRFIESLPDRVICVVDEAYFEYVSRDDYPNALHWIEQFPNLIVTRTFSKAYGIAGLRVGYAVSDLEISELMNRIRQPFNLNSLALAAAEAAADDDEHLRRSRQANQKGLALLSDELRNRGFGVIPSITNFVCVDVKQDSLQLFSNLLRQGVIVRPLAGYQMPNHIRVTVGTPDENRRFLNALDTVLSGV
ncbi:MAG: histidinol-phosphate transaminase [Gammaproteobacteria bacterium]